MALPSINATGLYELKAPFDSDMSEGEVFVCDAIEGFDSLVASGVDVYEVYYYTNDLDESVYKADVAAGDVKIVTLISDSNTISLPSSYIISFPTSNSITMLQTYIAINLGLLIEGFNLESLQSQLEEVVTTAIGVEAEARVVVHDTVNTLSNEEYNEFETARKAKIKFDKTTRTELEEALERNAELQQQIDVLNQYIIDQQS